MSKPTAEELRDHLMEFVLRSNTTLDFNALDNAITELVELREENEMVIDLYAAEILRYARASGRHLQAQDKLEKAVEGLETIESVDRVYVESHGHEGAINNIIGVAQQTLKEIKEDS